MERNITLDSFKIILSVLVISAHIFPLFGKDDISSWLISQGVSRLTVPCFFIINGFFLVSKINSKDAIKKYLSHLIIIYLVWSLIYLSNYATTLTTRVIVENLIFGYYHLWYLPSLMLGVLILYLIKRKIKNDSLIVSIAIVLFIAGCLLEVVPTIRIFDTYPNNFRNGLFFGFPFVTIGYYIRYKELHKNMKVKLLLPLTILGFGILFAESYYFYLKSYFFNLYIYYLLLCPVLFLLIMKFSVYKKNNVFLSYFGSLSAGIYFIHVFIFDRYIVFPTEYTIVKLPLLLLMATLFSIVIIYVNKRIKIFL
ncbi:MAG: acyltransferase family protein [Dysgonomonas sp.]|nr:acyltransferase family protein [Dysgonomonas sp.]